MEKSITDTFNELFRGKLVSDSEFDDVTIEMKKLAAQKGFSLRVVFDVEEGNLNHKRITAYTIPDGNGRASRLDSFVIG
jgi:hypothetical protein